jgi:hypothetical protein
MESGRGVPPRVAALLLSRSPLLKAPHKARVVGVTRVLAVVALFDVLAEQAPTGRPETVAAQRVRHTSMARMTRDCVSGKGRAAR